jgi:hypothetical protein
MTKTGYIHSSLRSISHKKWELFIVSRILQKLDDDEVEFVTQQLVRKPDGKRFLTDIYFPQFNIHLEVDERHHLDSVEMDRLREKDIIQATEHSIKRIEIFDQSRNEKSLDEIRTQTDEFIEKIRVLKKEKQNDGSFAPWDWDYRFSSAPVIDRGYLAVADNVTFRHQIEALRCFGFKGKGWQKGVWNIQDGSRDKVWFPRLYRHFIWNNEISADGSTIRQYATNEEGRIHNAKSLEDFAAKLSEGRWPENVIIFAKSKDSLGTNLLRYVGTFQVNLESSSEHFIQFDLLRTREDVRV